MSRIPKKTYAGIQAQIEKLQKEAEALRAAEVADVVSRIRQAIEHYGLTAVDLGLTPRAARSTARAGGRAAGTAKPRARASRSTRPAKYRDESGNSWSGRGKRPRWFVEALATGRTPEQLLARG